MWFTPYSTTSFNSPGESESFAAEGMWGRRLKRAGRIHRRWFLTIFLVVIMYDIMYCVPVEIKIFKSSVKKVRKTDVVPDVLWFVSNQGYEESPHSQIENRMEENLQLDLNTDSS